MGKRIIARKRGRGTTTYRSHSFRHKTAVKHRMYDSIEKTSVIKGEVVDLINCKGHSAPIAKVKYPGGNYAHIFAPNHIKVTDMVESGINAKPNLGNTLPLRNIPEGTLIYNIESIPGDGGKFCRSAGTFSRIIASRGSFVIVQLPSKKQKKLNVNCRATVGIIAGAGRLDKPLVKAGKVHHIMRAKGKLYPRTSGVAMNSVDHPFGSGRGRKHTKMKPCSQHDPPGRKVGPVRSRRMGKRK